MDGLLFWVYHIDRFIGMNKLKRLALNIIAEHVNDQEIGE